MQSKSLPETRKSLVYYIVQCTNKDEMFNSRLISPEKFMIPAQKFADRAGRLDDNLDRYLGIVPFFQVRYRHVFLAAVLGSYRRKKKNT